MSSLLSYPLSESLISWITLMKRIKMNEWNMITYRKGKSVKSFNQCQSVMQTICDIVKAHGGELKVETKEGEGSEFIIELPLV